MAICNQYFFMKPSSPNLKEGSKGVLNNLTPIKTHKESVSFSETSTPSQTKTKSKGIHKHMQAEPKQSSLEDLDLIIFESLQQKIAAFQEQNSNLRSLLRKAKNMVTDLQKQLELKQRQYLKEKESKQYFQAQLQTSIFERNKTEDQSIVYVQMYDDEGKKLLMTEKKCRQQETQIILMKRKFQALEKDLNNQIGKKDTVQMEKNQLKLLKTNKDADKLKEKENEIVKLVEERKNNEEKIKTLEKNEKKKEIQINQLKVQMKNNKKQLQEDKNRITVKMKKLQEESKNNLAKIKKLQEENNSHLAKIKRLQEESKNNLAKIKRLQEQNAKKVEEFNKQIKNLSDLKHSEEDKLNKTIKILNEKIIQTSKQRDGFKDQKDASKKKIQNLQQFMDRQKKELDTLTKTVQKLERLKQVLNGISETVIGEQEEVNYQMLPQQVERLKYFSGSLVFTDRNANKQGFISSQIKKFLQIKNFEYSLLYRFDPLNTINFHKYIDGHKNLIIFVKLCSGVVIGGFTVHPFEEKKNEAIGRGSGFIFSLSLEKIFKIRKDARQGVNTYDGFYFIFGNAEIRIRSQEKKIFSNFGIATSTFDTEKVTRGQFMGIKEGQNNEVEIETYEIYKLLPKE